jgi:hypothetical protein
MTLINVEFVYQDKNLERFRFSCNQRSPGKENLYKVDENSNTAGQRRERPKENALVGTILF